MKKKADKRKISLRWKIGRYLLFFGVGIIVLITVFQIFLLEPMYRTSKIKSVIGISDAVSGYIESDDLDSIIEDQQLRSDACIGVYMPSESMAMPLSNCIDNRLRQDEIFANIAKASESDDGTYLYVGDREMRGPFSGSKLRMIIYTRIIYGKNGNTVVMVNSGIDPLDATTDTLKKQLLLIGGIIVLGVILLTYILYRQIARPLALINAAAKTLPSGTYETDSSTNRYLEAQELNETLEKAAVDIRKADKAKRDLIANVSHDLRTPLTMITGYGEMMQDLPEEKTDENLQVIVDESRRLNALVNDLLDLSRMQEGRISLTEEEFDLSGLISLEMRKYDVYRMQEGYEIEEFISGGAVVKADRKRIAQVFNNFMTNAINYSGERKHIIVRETADRDYVKVEVRDFGEGISKEDLPNIWDRYYKVDKEHVRVSSGSGIGLSIVREILELHHAEYGCDSTVGEGSTFWFRLPLSEKGSE